MIVFFIKKEKTFVSCGFIEVIFIFQIIKTVFILKFLEIPEKYNFAGKKCRTNYYYQWVLLKQYTN